MGSVRGKSNLIGRHGSYGAKWCYLKGGIGIVGLLYTWNQALINALSLTTFTRNGDTSSQNYKHKITDYVPHLGKEKEKNKNKNLRSPSMINSDNGRHLYAKTKQRLGMHSRPTLKEHRGKPWTLGFASASVILQRSWRIGHPVWTRQPELSLTWGLFLLSNEFWR